MNDYIRQINPILDEGKLLEELEIKPDIHYDPTKKSSKLIALLNVYKLFIPSKTTIDIYYQLYLMLVNSLEKKSSLDQIRRLNENYRVINGEKRYGVIGGLESYRITGCAGAGKSSAIQRCSDVITSGKLIILEKPHREVIPILVVECVADGSFKSLLYSILQTVDSIIGTSYFIANKHTTTTVDSLLSVVSSVLINHVALLVIDECERVANSSRRGEMLINYLTQLVNQSNIPICFVGNESCNEFFDNREYLARRTTGITIEKMPYGEDFFNFVNELFKYQVVDYKVEINSELVRTLYSLSNGLPSILVSLFVEAQKESVISGEEKLTLDLLKKVFNERFKNMLPFLQSKRISSLPRVKDMQKSWPSVGSVDNKYIFKEFSVIARKDVDVFVQLIEKAITVELVKL